MNLVSQIAALMGAIKTDPHAYGRAAKDQEMFEFVEDHPGCTVREIQLSLGISRESTQTRLRRLLADGRVSKARRGNQVIWRAKTAA